MSATELARIRLAAVVLLAGTVRQTPLYRAAVRSRIDLPVRPGVTIGDYWSGRIEELRASIASPNLPLIVAANTIAQAPRDVARWRGAVVTMDSEEPRGSGGALRDAVRDLCPGSHVLVVPGHSYPKEALATILGRLWEVDADAIVHADAEAAPTGLFLIRCGALATLPAKGFVDLKEQALPQIASRGTVRVVKTQHAAPMAIRTLDGYIDALRVAAAGSHLVPLDAPAEEWRCTFAIAEHGADVHPTARLHDSIVLAGGRVGAEAVVVRSLVGPGGVVSAGEALFDELVGPESRSA